MVISSTPPSHFTDFEITSDAIVLSKDLASQELQSNIIIRLTTYDKDETRHAHGKLRS